MLRIGLIAEFNPFHNGHIFLLKKIKEIYPDSKIIVALSSNYTQRGEIACSSFSTRKKICKKYGVDKVIKLDFETSTQAAHVFAKGAIDKLNKNKIDVLFFGTSDTNDINKYIKASKLIKGNKEQYDKNVKKILKTGKSFIFACYESLKLFLDEKEIPEDILGFEYTKYVINNNINIKLNCIKRSISHHSQDISDEYASGTKLREMIKNNEDISKFSPLKIKKVKRIEDTYKKFKKIIVKTNANKLSKIKLMSEGMENLFKKNIQANSYDEFINLCTSKRYTSSRIKRVYLYVLKKKIKKNQTN
ncbi:nucleotidyltransferase [Metamycoplasma gateae]|uniref:Nucleotidyltransferase n=1 Tax=Metamycoplasma gateae TaxID=35769 RepID=A0ABZ2AHA6_9BACT|nr:nucleotidyltransferase [Metamycoplasma gateae]